MPSSTSTPNAVQPAAVQLLRQRLARRGAQPQARQVVVGLLEHRADHRRHVDEDRRPVAGDELEDPLGRRALGEDDPSGADAERVQRRQVARVAEEQLRHRQHDVVLADVEHAARVVLEAAQRRLSAVHAGLGHAGRAGRELPDRDVVGRGGRGVERVRRLRDERVEARLALAQLVGRDAHRQQRARPGPVAQLGARLAHAVERRRVDHAPRRPACSRGSTRSPWPAGRCRPRR